MPIVSRCISVLVIAVLFLFPDSSCTAQSSRSFKDAHWIWHPERTNLQVFFRRSFLLADPQTLIDANVLVAADDKAELYVNSSLIGQATGFQKPVQLRISLDSLRKGENVLALHAENSQGGAGILAVICFEFGDGRVYRIVSDTSWRCNESESLGWQETGFNDLTWPGARDLGCYPCMPWGRLLPRTWAEQDAEIAAYRQRWQDQGATEVLPGKDDSNAGEKASAARLFIDPQSHLLSNGADNFQLFFTIYNQMSPENRWRLSVLDFDYDLVERDFQVMQECGIHIYMRAFSWKELLDRNGCWKRIERQPVGTVLPDFEYVYEVYDYFFERAQAHGLQVVAEADIYWGLPEEIIPRVDYGGKLYLYDELWEPVVDAYAKCLAYLSRHANLMAILLGEEGAPFDLCLEEDRTRALFSDWLQTEYLSLGRLERIWGDLYDTADRSMWREEKIEGRTVLFPQYPRTKQVWESIRSFRDIPLPRWEYRRDPAQPGVPLREDRYRTFGLDVLEDPAAIDFFRWRQNLVHKRLQTWSRAMRKAAPNLILQFSSDADFCLPWHFPQYFDRTRLPFDVIGVGQHDHKTNFEDLPHWATVRELVQNTASYAPHVLKAIDLDTSLKPLAFASGEGMGSTLEDRDGVRRYFPAWLLDLYGTGAAYVLSYTWCDLSGRDYERRDDYSAPVLSWMRENLKQLREHPSTISEDTQVLILRNLKTIFSFQGGYDFGNTRALAGVLAQTHVPFHILPDEDVTIGDDPYRINLDDYRVIYIPYLPQHFEDHTWECLRAWLSDSRHTGERALMIGAIGEDTPYFAYASRERTHVLLHDLFGGTFAYSESRIVRGPQQFTIRQFMGRYNPGEEITITFPERIVPGRPNLSFLTEETIKSPMTEVLLTDSGQRAVAVRRKFEGNAVYLVGFPLGLACDALWGFEQDQEPFDALVGLFQAPLDDAGIEPPIRLPHNVVGYLSDDGTLLSLKERFGHNVKDSAELNVNGERREIEIALEPYEVKLMHIEP